MSEVGMENTILQTNGNTRIITIVQRVFRDYPGNLAVKLWTSETLKIGAGEPDVTIIFHQPNLFRNLILYRDPLLLAEAYIRRV